MEGLACPHTLLTAPYPLSGIVDLHWPELRKSLRSRMESGNFIHQDSPTLDHVNSPIHPTRFPIQSIDPDDRS